MKTTLLIIFCFFLYMNVAQAQEEESEEGLETALYESEKRKQHAQSKTGKTTSSKVEVPQTFYEYATWGTIFSFILILLILYSNNKIKSNLIYRLTTQNKEMKELNEELISLNEQLNRVNQTLEKKAKVKTLLLKRQNEKIIQYAFITAHKLRSPLASIMGLVNVMEMEMAEKEKVDELLIMYLKTSSQRLDEIIHEIQNTLEENRN